MTSGFIFTKRVDSLVASYSLFLNGNLDFYCGHLGPVLPSLFSVQFSSVQFYSIQFRPVRFRPVQFSSTLDNTFTLTYHYSFQFSSIQFSSDQFSSVQFNSIQIRSVQFSSAVLCRREQALKA